MMNRPLRYAIFTLAIAAVALLASCPLPITDRLVAAVEDGIDPFIIVDSPVDGSTYHSEVVFQGRIIEDALSSGDGRGQVSAISFFASNLSAYKGGIVVATDGSVTVDPAKGDVPITFNMATGEFSFTFDVRSFGQTIMEVFITAVDLNGNEHEVSTTLYESDGPTIDLQSPHPTTTSYTAGSAFDLLAFIGDSTAKPTTVEEIDRIVFSCPDLYVTNAVIDVIEDDPGPFRTTVTNLGMDLIFDPSDRSFRSELPISIPSTMDDTIDIIIDAVDFNGHTTSMHKELYSADGGPLVVINNPTAGSYYSSNSSTGIDISALVTLPTGSSSSISSVAVNLSSPDNNADTIAAYPSGGGAFDSGSNTFTYSFNAGARGHGGGPLNVIVIALDTAVKQGESSRTLLEDSDPPVVTVTSFTSAFGSDAYSRSGETVTLVFTVTDSGAGLGADLVGDNKLTVDLAGTVGVVPVEGPPGTWTATATTIAGIYTNDAVPFSISVWDEIGNHRTWDQNSSGSDPSIAHYFGNPSATVTVENGSNGSTTRAKVGDEIDIAVDVSGGRLIDTAASTMTLDSSGGGGLTVTLDEAGNDTLGPLTNTPALEGRLSYDLDLYDKAGNHTDFGVVQTSLYLDFSSPRILSGPTFEIIDNAPANTVSGVAMPNDDISLTFDITDDIDSITGSLTDPTVGFLDEGGGLLTPTNYDRTTDTVTVTYAVTTSSPQENIRYEISSVDLAGNPLNIGPAGGIVIDSNGPVASLIEFDDDDIVVDSWVNNTEGVTLSFTLSDGRDGLITDANGTKPEVFLVQSSQDVQIPAGSVDYVTTGTDRWEATVDTPWIATNLVQGGLGYRIDAYDSSGLRGTGPDQELAHDDGNALNVDILPPNLGFVSFESDNPTNDLAGSGDHIVLTIDAVDPGGFSASGLAGGEPSVVLTSENIDGPEEILSPIVLSPPGAHWTATYTVNGSSPMGLVKYDVTSTDIAGNVATALAGAYTISIDNEKPDISNLSISLSPGADQGALETGDVITWEFKIEDNGRLDGEITSVSRVDVEVLIEGQSNQPLTVSRSGGYFTASYTVKNTDVGGLGYRIKARDNALNEEEDVLPASDRDYLIVDVAGPQVTFVSATDFGGLFPNVLELNETFEIRFTAVDDIEGPINSSSSDEPVVELFVGGSSRVTIPSSTVNCADEGLGVWVGGINQSFLSGLPPGAIEYSISSTDDAGNTTVISGSTVVVIP